MSAVIDYGLSNLANIERIISRNGHAGDFVNGQTIYVDGGMTAVV